MNHRINPISDLQNQNSDLFLSVFAELITPKKEAGQGLPSGRNPLCTVSLTTAR
ncbi:MAG: hypothetical protein DI595_00300 [Agrobacterium fabrum]|uniref:Uncharacterized protein n=1 Tax=Agrobacterium fabrum TaxID=1176649 RepID=A0A2W5FEB9_9HYPH|nr:MAG: hypothetical protein DI595_00300 [Agrobacterium fabrum]